MPDHIKALVIKVNPATEPPGVSFAWDKLPQMEVFTKNILIPEIGGDQKGAAPVSIGSVVSGMPTAYARSVLFDNALRLIRDKKEASGLLLFYKSLLSEWKGLISCLALNYKDISIQRVHLGYTDGLVISQTENIYEPKGAFGNALFERKLLWCDQSLAGNAEKIPFIDVISYKGQVLGGTSPDSLLFTSVSYRIGERLPFVDVENGKLTDPLRSDLRPEELDKLYGYAKYILGQLEQFRMQYADLDEHLRPDYSNVANALEEWIRDMIQYQQSRNFNKLDLQTPPETGTLFQEPFAKLFNYSTILYGSEGVVSADATSDVSIAFDPKDLLLPDSTEIAQFDFGMAGTITKGYLRDKPILILPAETKGQADKYAYFALPLTPLALNVFGANLEALLGLNDTANVRSRLSGMYDPTQQEGEKLTVQLKLITDSGSEIIKQVVYPIIADTIRGRDILIWPNFISRQWGRYFLYSEIPHNDATFQATPFIGNTGDDYFRIALDGSGRPYYLASKGRSNVAPEGTGLETSLHISSGTAVADNKYKYEIYESNQPFKGLRFSHAGNECGFGIIRYTGLTGGKMLPLNMLSSVKTLSSAALGVDFGSTNTSVAYWSETQNRVCRELRLSNKRVSLLGTDIKNNDERPAVEDEIFFFQNDEIQTNSIKSVLTLHDTRRVVNDRGLQLGSLLSQAVKGGFPCFEKNLPIDSATENRYILNYPRAGSAELVYNMKWSSQELDKSCKTAYLSSLLLHIYAQLFIEGHEPHTLKWSYPSSMGKDMLNEYRAIWDSLVAINPLKSSVKLKIYRPSDLSDIGDTGEEVIWNQSNPSSTGWSTTSSSPSSSSGWITEPGSNWAPAPAETGWGTPPTTVEEEVDIQVDNGPLRFDFEQLRDNESLSEACAVANYMLRPEDGYSVSQGELLLCFDIGGSTTDITVLSDLGRGKAMIKQNSIRFAAERLAQATRFSPNFKNVLLRMCEQKKIFVQGLNRGENKFSDNTAPYYFEQVVDRLDASDYDIFYRLIAAECREMMSVNLYITGLIMFYAGQLVHKLRQEIVRSEDATPLVKQTNPKVRIAFAGKGARIFDWFNAVNDKAAEDYYTQMFLRGIGGEAVARQTIVPFNLNPLKIVDINSQRGKDNADVKYEVSKGLAIPTGQTHILVPKNKQAIEILGEDNFCIVRPDGRVEYLPSTNSVSPQMLEHIGRYFLHRVEGSKPPCPRFMDFADLFYRVSSSMFGLKMTPGDFMAGFQDMNIENYIKAIPEFIAASNRKQREQKKFDYVAPVIILEGMKFFEKHLLKGIQAN
ncbi:hypothetical protein FPZ42_07075 [Mucilaginibacter achroorhodeus]|uniref:Uncharacterized protein n=1 Tax=Mucilaginibacter achroorhodeus TaxID=2599294 RepID=A0A563U643_9SPHI|nr:hypothetical protein [Mucilaginibacter achroorhodeus]TWR26793.1 hypothetical protein FPZ42_07075 [Mucilaginibacter achroorhodeus]